MSKNCLKHKLNKTISQSIQKTKQTVNCMEITQIWVKF